MIDVKTALNVVIWRNRVQIILVFQFCLNVQS